MVVWKGHAPVDSARGSAMIRKFLGAEEHDRTGGTGRTVYRMGCSLCGHVYGGANGSDIHFCRRPVHDRSAPGLAYEADIFAESRNRAATLRYS